METFPGDSSAWWHPIILWEGRDLMFGLAGSPQGRATFCPRVCHGRKLEFTLYQLSKCGALPASVPHFPVHRV